MERFIAPNRATVEMHVRPGTNDHNVCYSILTEDEYHLDAIKPLSGVALDVGAHIGAATVALCELNPELRVVAIEPVPDNAALLRLNTARYGERVTVLEAAAGTNDTIAYNWRGSESARHHRYIGNQHFDPSVPHDEALVPTVSLSALVEQYGPLSFIKIDCEGCEDTFLADPAIEQVALVHGEFHNGPAVELRFYAP